MDRTESRLAEGSDISQAFVEDGEGRVFFTANGIKFWWPKIRHAGVDPRTIKTKAELQYAVRRVAVTAFRETAEESEKDLLKRGFMSPMDRAALRCLTASPDEFEQAVKAYERIKDPK
ncbi:hypothetical protein [Acidithiobacillus caldus]|uniref:Uncharacterized protein n=2 Tax=Acidithiobacillus caldus TaxID=33059 RepID=F9ZRX9_ACICS|nr:hypothetical protein [Acidithiobacillus caldus]AEK58764.1 hypothetical protein Atc_2116 [Acidithiobacillus caldus SM-1]OFC35529.1 hypothetical protein BAE29_15360 [Acidithiobacillus caldus]OFC36378.1 hypothetical protein BAE27_06260 [Acidithiobacillus caldus]OFC40444.1 hypothetical protein BAE28_00080 [Acidithiobacillus caldus]OFC62484.1 hypothetical protein BAE30_01845 [Acidithiobacillus caldus]